MQNSPSFYKYYDMLFSKKDYNNETDYILNSWYKNNKKEPSSILDFGCGTGSHTLAFAERGFNIVGYDIDEAMISIAQSKIPLNSKVRFICADIISIDSNNKFDIIYAYFFVINYITELNILEAIFNKFYSLLKDSSILLFDTVNGNATSKDNPKIKEIDEQKDNIAISGVLKPQYNSLLNSAQYHYDLKVIDNNTEIDVDYYMDQIYWNPNVLIQLLKKSGFRKVKVFKHLSEIEGGGPDDYKISWYCQK